LSYTQSVMQIFAAGKERRFLSTEILPQQDE